MSFTAITQDVLVSPGVGAYNMYASGNLLKGQGVYLADDKTVAVPTDSSKRLFGIVQSNVNHGDPVAIYGPYNIVYCSLSGSVTAGTFVGLISEGYLSNSSDYSSQAIVIKGTTSTGDGKILIL